MVVATLTNQERQGAKEPRQRAPPWHLGALATLPNPFGNLANSKLLLLLEVAKGPGFWCPRTRARGIFWCPRTRARGIDVSYVVLGNAKGLA
jgi:hypothetical protein